MRSEWNKYSISDISKINPESLKKGHTLSVIEYLDIVTPSSTAQCIIHKEVRQKE